jgi:glycosyltransferase involved in cell wall biosynthesis
LRLADILEFIDPWTISQSILRPKIDTYLKANHHRTDNVWYPDMEIVFPERLQNETNIQVVLFGSFFEKIFETGNWPEKNYTLWCMCTRVKNILTEVCLFPEASVKCIPRYELFNKGSPKFLNFNQPINLVYSGRLSSQKNIEFFLAFASSLEKLSPFDVHTTLLGKWDNRIPKHRGRYIIDSYQTNINYFLSKLRFENSPVFIEDLGPEEWLNYLEGNSLLVSFSSSIAEDYGVSIAQAQEIGVPLLISDWGGHGDVDGNNVYHIPLSMIGESFSADEKNLLYAEKLAQLFIKNSHSFNKNASVKKEEKASLEILTLRDFEQIRLNLMQKHGFEMGLLGQNLMSLYASSEKGKDFFKVIKNKMMGN